MERIMTALGVLEAIRPAEQAASERISPARPGDDGAPLLSTAGNRRPTSSQDLLTEARYIDAQRSRDRALRRVKTMRSSTNVAALAQTHATLGENEASNAAAREALDLSLRPRQGSAEVTDPASARIAAEVLMRCGHADYAYEALRHVPLSASMSVTFALLANALGKIPEAEEALASHDGPLVDSFRGYLYALTGSWQEAVRHLRDAVSKEPDDADALLNLSIALWHLGSMTKATRVALRAARTAPGRQDISLHYLELLLAQGATNRLNAEIASLKKAGVIDDARFLVFQVRALLAIGEKAKAITLLDRAVAAAKREGDRLTEGTAAGNLVLLRYESGRLSRDQASQRLTALMGEFFGNDAIAVNFAEIARSKSEAASLREALERLGEVTTPIRRAYLKHQLAVLEGDTDAAGSAAAEWFELERDNPMAATAAVIAVGIGQGRWNEAVAVADYALSKFPHDRALVNNSAYVLAMNGRAEEAIALLEPIAGDDFVLIATLGLAYLAYGDLDRGMRLYREAADMAERIDPAWRSLMTAYQALIVRQLGIDKTTSTDVLPARALVPFDLPDDWRDRPDFLRIQQICAKHGYDWPLAL